MPTAIDDGPYLSPAAAACRAGVSEQEMHRLVLTGSSPAVNVPSAGQWLIHVEALDGWLGEGGPCRTLAGDGPAGLGELAG